MLFFVTVPINFHFQFRFVFLTMELEYRELHKYHINAVTKSLQDFQFPLEYLFVVAEFPTYTDPRQSTPEHITFRFPEVNHHSYHEQVLYPFQSEPAEYLLAETQFRELLATTPFICEVLVSFIPVSPLLL